MSQILNLKSSHKPVKIYYQELTKLQEQGYHNGEHPLLADMLFYSHSN